MNRTQAVRRGRTAQKTAAVLAHELERALPSRPSEEIREERQRIAGGLGRRGDGPVNPECPSLDVGGGDRAPEAAVVGAGAVVSQRKIRVGRDLERRGLAPDRRGFRHRSRLGAPLTSTCFPRTTTRSAGRATTRLMKS